MAKLATTALLTRHLLRMMAGQRLRTAMVWLALVASLAVIIGVVSFLDSVDNSFKARGAAVRGISDAQIQAVGRSTLPASLARDVEDVRGTRFAIAMDEQRVAITSGKRRSVTATAIGIDRRARRLRSSLRRQMNVPTPRDPARGGISLSTQMAARLGVAKGDKVRILAFSRSPKIKIQRVVDVAPALEEVIVLPRKSIERLRGPAGRPNTIFVKLKDGTSVERWRKRAKSVLPGNALIVTPPEQQGELDKVLDVTTRSYIFVFGSVALLIAMLLVYVMQLMRMIDRQEDAGLVRALGSRWGPLAAAEVLTLTILLLLALPVGVLLGHAFAENLSGNLPDFLTQVFNFTMNLRVEPRVVLGAAVVTLAVASLATVGALVATRRPVADQLGRSPQAGATTTATVSPRAAVILTVAGVTAMALSGLPTKWGAYPAAALIMLLGLSAAAPGIAALMIHGITRIRRADGAAVLVARSALGSHPRRVGMSVAIMALAVSAVVPLQLLDNALGERTDKLVAVHKPSINRVSASSDLFMTVPVSASYARRVLEGDRQPRRQRRPQVAPGQTPPSAAVRRRRARYARVHQPLPSYATPFAVDFTRYRNQRISIMAVDARKRWPYRGRVGLREGMSTLKRHRNQVAISAQLASWSGLKAGDKIRLRTAKGPRSQKIGAVINDMSWPMGTVYFDITRYRKLYGWDAINSLVVKRGKIDRAQIAEMRPLHTFSGKTMANRIRRQMTMTRDNILAMRLLIVLAALVAVSGILATSILARRREWGVLRAVGIKRRDLLLALGMEVALILVLGAALGAIAGILVYEGQVLTFMADQGFPIARNVEVLPLVSTATVAVLVGLLTVMTTAMITARTRITDALSYE